MAAFVYSFPFAVHKGYCFRRLGNRLYRKPRTAAGTAPSSKLIDRAGNLILGIHQIFRQQHHLTVFIYFPGFIFRLVRIFGLDRDRFRQGFNYPYLKFKRI